MKHVILSETDIIDIRRLRDQNEPWPEIAKLYKVSTPCIRAKILSLIKEGKWEGDYIEKKPTTSRHAKKFIPPLGKTYAQRMKEKGINLNRYIRNETWGGSIKSTKKPRKSELSAT